MGGIFDADSTIMNVMNKVMNTVILNLCFLVSCIPVITAGAALTALYAVNMKMVKDEESYVFKAYWKAFRENFRQSTAVWCIVAMAGIIFAVDFRVIQGLEGVIQKVLAGGVLALFLVYVVLVLYIFPYIARFRDNLATCMKNALIIGGSNIGFTITVLLITAACIAVTFWSAAIMLRAMFIWLVAGFSLLSYIQCVFLRKVFDKYGK